MVRFLADFLHTSVCVRPQHLFQQITDRSMMILYRLPKVWMLLHVFDEYTPECISTLAPKQLTPQASTEKLVAHEVLRRLLRKEDVLKISMATLHFKRTRDVWRPPQIVLNPILKSAPIATGFRTYTAVRNHCRTIKKLVFILKLCLKNTLYIVSVYEEATRFTRRYNYIDKLDQ